RQLRNRGQTRMGLIAVMASVDAQRAAMRPKLLDVEYAHAVRREYLLGGECRKVRKVLVVDLVELVAGHRFEKMRQFDRADPARLQDDANTFDEGVEVRDLGEDVVAKNKVGL